MFGRRLKFDFEVLDKAQVYLSDDGQSIRKYGSNCVWTGTVGNKPVFSSGKTFFDLEVREGENTCYVMVGYTLDKDSWRDGFYSKSTGYTLYL